MRIIIDGVQEGEDRTDPSYLNRAKIAVDGVVDGKEKPPTLSQVLDSGSGIATTQSIIDLSSGASVVAYSTTDNSWHFYGVSTCATYAVCAGYANTAASATTAAQATTAQCAACADYAAQAGVAGSACEAGYACSAGEACYACSADHADTSDCSTTTSSITYQLGDNIDMWYPSSFYAWTAAGDGNWTMLPGYATGIYYSYDGGVSYTVAEVDCSGYFTASVYTACMANEAYCAQYANTIRYVYWDDFGSEQCADLYISYDPCTYCWSSMDLTVGFSYDAGAIRAPYDDGCGQYSTVNFTYNTTTGYVEAPCLSVECASHASSADYSAEAWAIFDNDNSVYVHIYGDPSGSTPPYFDGTAWQTITVDGQDYTVLVSTMCAP